MRDGEYRPPPPSADRPVTVLIDDDRLRHNGDDPRLPLETSMAGVFAVGDVRDGSVKRVAAAVGEGSAVVKLAHAHLERLGRLATANAR
jgi:thioredoxin reductase